VRGQELLANWEQVAHRFWHVVPHTVAAAPIAVPIQPAARRVAVALG
jgi:glutamate synthase domain-containing protein 3